ncbi:MAG: HPr family phosphocarrier protein [Candidatus Binataceae bacterium]
MPRRSFTGALDTFIVEPMSAAEATVEVKNRLGLHLRAASTLSQEALKFDATITISRGKNSVSARSITGLMTLGAGQGSKLKIRAEGRQAREALVAVRQLFEARFGED